jgi:ribonuclease E
MAIDVMRILALAANRSDIRRVNICVAPAVATYLNNRKRRELAQLESESGLVIHVRHEQNVPAEHLMIDCFDAQNSEVRLLPPPPAPHHARRGR